MGQDSRAGLHVQAHRRRETPTTRGQASRLRTKITATAVLHVVSVSPKAVKFRSRFWLIAVDIYASALIAIPFGLIGLTALASSERTPLTGRQVLTLLVRLFPRSDLLMHRTLLDGVLFCCLPLKKRRYRLISKARSGTTPSETSSHSRQERGRLLPFWPKEIGDGLGSIRRSVVLNEPFSSFTTLKDIEVPTNTT